MPADRRAAPAAPVTMEWAVEEILACPHCRGSVVRAGRGLACARCARTFETHAGIPALVTGRFAPEMAQELAWYSAPQKPRRPLPDGHHFAHAAARAPIAEELRRLGFDERALVLSVATGTGVEIPFIRQVSERIVAIDASTAALQAFRHHWPYLAFQADAGRLPFKDESFDAVVVCALLHHLAGYTALDPYLTEFVRVTRTTGSVIAVEPNAWYPVQWVVGPINRAVQRIHPGWRGLVPHERPLSPRLLTRQFASAGLARVHVASTTFVHNRFPRRLSERIVAWERRLRTRRPVRSFGWWVLVSGRREAGWVPAAPASSPSDPLGVESPAVLRTEANAPR
jgi:SAM-dependent methyltransferase